MSVQERRDLLRIMRAIRERATLNGEWIDFHYWNARLTEMTEGVQHG